MHEEKDGANENSSKPGDSQRFKLQRNALIAKVFPPQRKNYDLIPVYQPGLGSSVYSIIKAFC